MQQIIPRLILHFNRQHAIVSKVELVEKKRGDCTDRDEKREGLIVQLMQRYLRLISIFLLLLSPQ